MEQLIIRKARKQHTELIGKKFGRLTVKSLLGYTYKPYGKTTIHEPVYSLLCDCNKVVTLRRLDFKYGNTKSCGCLRKDIVYEKHSNNRSISDIIFYKTQIMNSYIRKANSKDREFELTYQQFDNFISGNCEYCGTPPTNQYTYKKKDVSLPYNGVDRLDPNKGYTLSNCVSCCKICNFLKGSLNKEEFLNQVKSISSHCGLSQQCELKNWAKSVKASPVDTEVIYN